MKKAVQEERGPRKNKKTKNAQLQTHARDAGNDGTLAGTSLLKPTSAATLLTTKSNATKLAARDYNDQFRTSSLVSSMSSPSGSEGSALPNSNFTPFDCNNLIYNNAVRSLAMSKLFTDFGVFGMGSAWSRHRNSAFTPYTRNLVDSWPQSIPQNDPSRERYAPNSFINNCHNIMATSDKSPVMISTTLKDMLTRQCFLPPTTHLTANNWLLSHLALNSK